MPQKSRWTIAVPEVSIPTFMFGSPNAPLGDGLAYADADDPATLSMTWNDFRLWSQRFAAGLVAAGLQKGDRVVIFSPNNIFYPVVFTGVVMAGGIYSPANAKFVPRELAYHLQASGAKFLLVSDANLACALEAAKAAALGRRRIFLFNDAPLEREGGGQDNTKEKVRHWKHLLVSKEVGSHFTWAELTPKAAKETTAGLIFSSGFVFHASRTFDLLTYVVSTEPQVSRRGLRPHIIT
jgi:4-coumarate--CoA ligase